MRSQSYRYIPTYLIIYFGWGVPIKVVPNYLPANQVHHLIKNKKEKRKEGKQKKYLLRLGAVQNILYHFKSLHPKKISMLSIMDLFNIHVLSIGVRSYARYFWWVTLFLLHK